MLGQYFGYFSGLLILLSFVLYIRGIFRNETKPERASWFIWSILGGISFFSQFAKGATNSLWLTGFQTLGDLSIFLLAIRYGMGGFFRRDKISLAAAGLSLVAWYFTREAAIALFIVIFIDAVGAYLTIVKTYEQPATEPVSAWVLTSLGGFFALWSVGRLDFVLLSFPVYIFLVNLAIVAAIFAGRRRGVQRAPKSGSSV